MRFKSVSTNVLGYPSILIMNERSSTDELPNSVGITLRDVVSIDSGPITFQEGLDCVAEDITIYNPIVDSRSDYAGFCAKRSAASNPGRDASNLTGVFRNIRVYNSPHTGIVIHGLTKGEVSGLLVDGYGSAPDAAEPLVSGVSLFNTVNRPGLVTVGSIESLDSGSSGYPPLYIHSANGDWTPVTGACFYDRGGHRLTGTVGQIFRGNNGGLFSFKPMIPVFEGRVSVLNPTFTSSIADGLKYLEFPLWTQAEGRARYLLSEIVFADAPTGGGSCTFTIRKRTAAGVLTALAVHPTATNATAAGTVTVPTGTLVMDRPEATMDPGDQLILTCQRDTIGTEGLGVDCPDVRVYLALFQYEVD